MSDKLTPSGLRHFLKGSLHRRHPGSNPSNRKHYPFKKRDWTEQNPTHGCAMHELHNFIGTYIINTPDYYFADPVPDLPSYLTNVTEKLVKPVSGDPPFLSPGSSGSWWGGKTLTSGELAWPPNPSSLAEAYIFQQKIHSKDICLRGRLHCWTV